MTDPAQPFDGLGPPPQPDDAARERAIAGAMAHFDDLTVDGMLTTADRDDAAGGGDELSRRRQAKHRRRSPQRWLAAAAVLLVLGVSGALVAQLGGTSDDQVVSQAGDQAEAGAASTEAPVQADQSESGAPQTAPGRAGDGASKPTAPSNAAPEVAGAPAANLPEWLCELTARLGFDVCAR